MLVLVFVLAPAEDFLQEVFLFGLGGWLGRVRRVSVGWSVWGLANDGCAIGGWRCGGVGGGGFVATDAEDFLDEVLRILAHLTAGVDGCGAV